MHPARGRTPSSSGTWRTCSTSTTRPLRPDAARVVCLDETSRQLLADARAAAAGRARAARRATTTSTCAAGWSTSSWSASRCAAGAQVRGQRPAAPALDWAHCIKDLVDVHYPDAERIVLVLDHLNTHSPASLYEAFPPAEAKRLADKLEIHYTPKHGSWLNMAEIELSVLQPAVPATAASPTGRRWSGRWPPGWRDRNAAATTIDWRFTTADARIKLKRLYPAHDD